jgi:hypothetical protein
MNFSKLFLFALFLFGANAMAQTAAITVGTASGLPGAIVTVPVTFAAGATPVSTLQFDLMFPPSILYGSTATGAAATAASKTASANPIAGGVRILIFGLNTNAISSGTIATIQFTISGSAPAGNTPISIAGIVASDPNAAAVATNGTAGYIQVQAPADTTPPAISAVASSNITSSGATITWATNENADTQVDYGTSTSYGSSTDLITALSTSHSQALTGLTAGSLYHYRVKSRDAAGNLATSGDYTFTTTAAPDTTPPAISGVASSSVSSSAAAISWATNEAADTQIEYGTTAAYGSSTALIEALSTSHSQALTGLTANTLYHYRVMSRDAAGNLAASGDYTFTTTEAADTTPPAISDVTYSDVTPAGVTVAWKTDEAADSQVDYGSGSSYGSSTGLDAAMVLTHSQVITGLASDKTYHFRVKSKDAAGNIAVSGDYTFSTGKSPDTTPPSISAVASSNITSSGATITWTTNENADTQVEYGLTNSYGSSTTLNSAMALSHSQGLAGLSANTLYHYRVMSKDAAGNLAASGDYTFTTAKRSAPPVISALAISDITSKSATISWTTDRASDSIVEYGNTTQLGLKSALGDMVTKHSLTINELQKLSQYFFRVKSADAEGNQAVTPIFSFNTPGNGTIMVALPRFTPRAPMQNPDRRDETMIGMALANMGVGTAALTFTAVDDNGNLITGPGIVNPETHHLEPGMQRALVDLSIFGEGIAASEARGWIKLESSSPDVSGFFLTFDGDLTLMDGANFGYSPLKTFVLTEIEATGSTKINLANPGSGAATVSIDLMKADGTVRHSKSRTINGNGALDADLYGDLFGEAEPDATDYILMRSTEGVQPFELMQKNSGDIASLTGQDATAGGTTLYSPQFVLGGPWKTSLSIVNLDRRPGMVTLELIGEDGVPIGDMRAIAIAANGKVLIDDPEFFTIPDPGVVTSGYLKIESDGIRLAGSTVFGDASGGSFSSALPLIYRLKNSALYSHVASNDTYFTGVAVLNPGAEDANVVIDIIGADGGFIDRRIFWLPAKQKKARLLTEYFPSLIGKDQSSGYIRLESDKPIASFSLFGTNSLSVLSAIPAQ